MKANQILRFNLLLIFVLTGSIACSKAFEEKSKKISKTYKVNPSVTLGVINQFGKVHFNTWEKNEFKVEVEIIARGKDHERAQKLLDKITVEIDESKSEIGFETVFASSMNTKNEESFEVNYLISAPAKNPVKLRNKFGDTYVGRREGVCNLEISYGNLKAEDLLGKLDLTLSFGNGTVGKTKDSNVRVEYSNLEIASGENMEMEQKFSDVEMESVSTLKLESKYGSMELGKVDKVEADAQYSGFSIDELTGSLYLEASYVSDFKIGRLHKSFSKVEIYGKFSAYEINLEEGLKANIEAEFSFANLKEYYDNMEFFHRVKEGNRSEYKGRIGGGDPDKKIIVKSSYGDLRIR